MSDPFERYLGRWALVPDGSPFRTATARLLPALSGGRPAILKLAEGEEAASGALMAWWDGGGAAPVLRHDGAALLLDRAEGGRRLAAMAGGGRDEEACRILCSVAARLHAPRPGPPPRLIPLQRWFRDLEPAAAAEGGILLRAAEAARRLLAEPRDSAVLHGDLHHGNVLDFGAAGWLAIDPKGLAGERGFDVANIFTNPDLDDPGRPLATRQDRFLRRLEIVGEAAGLERQRLLCWILAWAGLSAVWSAASRPHADVALQVAALAAAELDR